MTWLLLIALVATAWLVQTKPEGTAKAASTYQATVPTPAPPAFGLAFVNAAENPSRPERIRRGIEAGAQMDRFPLYWDRIETGYAQFDWTAQDAALRANEAAGLATLAVLLGTPGHYYPRGRTQTEIAHPTLGGSFVRYAGQVIAQSGCQIGQGPPAPAGLFNPIFVDGSDDPTPGKAVNPDNYWARFVHTAVNRYRAGGSAGLHVRHWEIWNEPDLCHFWSGTPQEYARLLKVAYLVIKQSDPEATVLWGGLAHFADEQFLYSLIDTLKRDPLAAAHNGFFDAAASHHYSIAWHSFLYTDRLRRALDTAGWPGKSIWITESGVPVCDDYPGPPCPSDWRARPLEQAAYVWQNVAYTRLGGGGPIFHFMLHDDCGNIVAVDSPDGFGLAKNEASSFCSPANAEQRLAYTAYQLATQYFPNTDLLWADVQQNWTVRRVAFYHPETTERRLLTWSIVGHDVAATLPATGAEARLLALDGSQTLLRPTHGIYTLTLPAATNHNWPNGSGGYDIGIYGAPYLLIEKDILPPDTAIEPLPVHAPPTFPVTWRAEDLGSGVASVALWFRVEGGEWQRWQTDQPATGTLSFMGEIGYRYQFAALAADRAGNALTSPTVQAETEVLDRVEVAGHFLYAPFISR